jgi:transcription initiation factor TFIID subunit 6
MACLNEEWLQGVARSYRVPPLRPAVTKALLPSVEYRLRVVIQDANKFMKRGKRSVLTVEDINQALALHGVEPLYGLAGAPASIFQKELENHGDSAGVSESLSIGIVSLSEMAKGSLPKLPLLAELTTHWLAVDGVQPIIPENPSILVNLLSHDLGDHPQLSKEMCQFYYRVTGILSSADSGDRSLRAVLVALGSDNGLQELLPHFSLYIQKEIKANTKSLRKLKSLISAVEAIWSNPYLHVEFHLQQMLPAVFTCIVASKLGFAQTEDHWSLRSHAAIVIAKVCAKFSSLFPDLQARICKTYIDALQSDKSLTSVYGGLVGLSSLGQRVVRTVLLPTISSLVTRLKEDEKATNLVREMVTSAVVEAVGMFYVKAMQLHTRQGASGETMKRGSVTKRRRVDANTVSVAPPLGPQIDLPAIGAEEPLIRYYASVAPEADHCRYLL